MLQNNARGHDWANKTSFDVITHLWTAAQVIDAKGMEQYSLACILYLLREMAKTITALVSFCVSSSNRMLSVCRIPFHPADQARALKSSTMSQKINKSWCTNCSVMDIIFMLSPDVMLCIVLGMNGIFRIRALDLNRSCCRWRMLKEQPDYFKVPFMNICTPTGFGGCATWWSKKQRRAFNATALKSTLQTQHFSELSGTKAECFCCQMDPKKKKTPEMLWPCVRVCVCATELNKEAFTAKWPCRQMCPHFLFFLSMSRGLNSLKGVHSTLYLGMSPWIIHRANVTPRVHTWGSPALTQLMYILSRIV